MLPICKGWQWNNGAWTYDKKRGDEDTRSPLDRTKKDIYKSFDSVIDFLLFTTETAEDFQTKTLPTLDG